MDDLISRKMAIDEFTNIGSNFVYGEGVCKAIVSRLKQLPPVQPERKKGKWIWMGDKGDSRFMCSVCKSKENVPTIMGKPTVWDYCPNCGAQMKGENDG